MNNEQPHYRETRQRKKILAVLCSTKTHPTADWVYEQVKKDFPHLSLGTVYRNLRILRDQGRILELPFGDTFDRFDGRTGPHPHFVCRKCHGVLDVGEGLPTLNIETLDKMKCKVEEVRISFYGLCPKCHRPKGG